jgi:hypothetical protein
MDDVPCTKNRKLQTNKSHINPFIFNKLNDNDLAAFVPSFGCWYFHTTITIVVWIQSVMLRQQLDLPTTTTTTTITTTDSTQELIQHNKVVRNLLAIQSGCEALPNIFRNNRDANSSVPDRLRSTIV